MKRLLIALLALVAALLATVPSAAATSTELKSAHTNSYDDNLHTAGSTYTTAEVGPPARHNTAATCGEGVDTVYAL